MKSYIQGSPILITELLKFSSLLSHYQNENGLSQNQNCSTNQTLAVIICSGFYE